MITKISPPIPLHAALLKGKTSYANERFKFCYARQAALIAHAMPGLVHDQHDISGKGENHRLPRNS